MKKGKYFRFKKAGKRVLLVPALFILVVLFSELLGGCVTALSPQASVKGKELGAGLVATAGNLPVTRNMNLKAVAGYNFYKFDNGHDNFFKLGAQIRHSTNSSPVWFGGEVSVVRDVSIYDYDFYEENPHAMGFAVGAIAGYKLPVESLQMSVFSGLSLVNFGDFKADGYVIEESHSPLQFRIGLEIELPFTQ